MATHTSRAKSLIRLMNEQGTLLMDRVERLTIRRSATGTVVKLVVTEGGITVDYSVKTYEYNLPDSIRDARSGCDRFLKLAREA